MQTGPDQRRSMATGVWAGRRHWPYERFPVLVTRTRTNDVGSRDRAKSLFWVLGVIGFPMAGN